MVICPERGADLHTAQLMPLPLTVSCFSEVQIGLTFLVPAHLMGTWVVPEKGPLAGGCVCVCWTRTELNSCSEHAFSDGSCVRDAPTLQLANSCNPCSMKHLSPKVFETKIIGNRNVKTRFSRFSNNFQNVKIVVRRIKSLKTRFPTKIKH